MSTPCDLPPCRHFADMPRPGRCLIGRKAQRDCGPGCPAYDADPAACAGLEASDRTICEVWTRVMGYHRPVAAFNAGKQAEHAERLYFKERPCGRPPAGE